MAKDLHITFLLDFYGDMLTDKQREVVECYYNEDLSLAEIADELGVSRQGVHDNITRAEAHLAKMEAKTGCVRRNLQSRQAMQAILSVAKELEQYPDPKVRDAVAKIAAVASSIEE